MDAILANRPATLAPSRLLRLALGGDAVASGAMGGLMLGAGAALAGPLGLPTALLQGAGALLLPYAALVGWMSRRAALPAWWVRAVIGLNLAWTAESLLLPAVGFVAPTMLGAALLAGQALAVAGFAVAQAIGLRQSRG
jgi:hypothetical protein